MDNLTHWVQNLSTSEHRSYGIACVGVEDSFDGANRRYESGVFGYITRGAMGCKECAKLQDKFMTLFGRTERTSLDYAARFFPLMKIKSFMEKIEAARLSE